MYPLIEIFGRTIGTYALCAVAGIFVSLLFFWKHTRTIKFSIDDILLLSIPTVLGLVAMGHLLYGMTHLGEIVQILSYANQISLAGVLTLLGNCFGGSVFYGGMIGAYLTFAFCTRKYEKPKKDLLCDTLAMSIPLFHVFGRIGCFLGGCCYGIESAFGFTVHDNPLVPTINDVNRFPVALAEALGNLLIFLVLYYLSQKIKGKVIYVYLLLYPVLRFSLEFLRGDEIRGIYFGLSTSQWISIALFVFSAISLLFFKRKRTVSA